MIDGVVTEAEVWLFDLDGTLIDSLTGGSLRPLAETVLNTLHSHGVTVVMWSAGGDDYARRRCKEHGIIHLIHEFHDKAVRTRDGRWESTHIRTAGVRMTFVDDRPEEAPEHGRLLGVRPYIGPNPHDRGLRDVLEAARALPPWSANGHSQE